MRVRVHACASVRVCVCAATVRVVVLVFCTSCMTRVAVEESAFVASQSCVASPRHLEGVGACKVGGSHEGRFDEDALSGVDAVSCEQALAGQHPASRSLR